MPKGLLAHGKEWSCPKSNLNGKARTARIQEYPRTVRACTYAIEPPYTERYVRWCERSARYLASYSIAGNPRTTQPPNAEQKSQSFLPLSDKALAFSVVLKGMPTNHFPFCGYSFQNGLGFQRDGSSFGSGFPIGARAPCWLGNPKGTAFPWQWFPKAAALPWREESNGG